MVDASLEMETGETSSAIHQFHHRFGTHDDPFSRPVDPVEFGCWNSTCVNTNAAFKPKAPMIAMLSSIATDHPKQSFLAMESMAFHHERLRNQTDQSSL
jgi:hypothetical protein